jgi:sugar/nucleoside kinase (ribokinase family)
MQKIIGIGNALVDIITFLNNDSVLKDFSIPIGSMQLVDADMALKVEDATIDSYKHMASGGSAANTIHGLAKLGIETGFIGTIGRDPLGDFFRKDLIESGIEPILTVSNSKTGRAISLVTPDGERTFATFLGAAIELGAEQLNSRDFANYDHLHIEGYLLPNHQLVEASLDLAKKNNLTVSLDLASYNVVETNLDFLKQILKRNIHIVFANEDEARVFSGQTDPDKALEILASQCDTAVVKIGSKGSLIRQGNRITEIGIIKANCLDTTGAGDLYAAGYLYGYANRFAPEQSGKIGSLLAGKVIEEPGAKISSAVWDTIMEEVKTIHGLKH